MAVGLAASVACGRGETEATASTSMPESETTESPAPYVTSAPRDQPWSGPLSGPTETGPLPIPPDSPFVSDPAFPECVHPGVARDCQDGWCRVPAGCFVLGSPETEIGRAAFAEEQAAVTLTHDFEIQETEVTLAEWNASGMFGFPNEKFGLNGSGPCTDSNCPVTNATWYQALQHANWLSEQRDLDPCYRVYECDVLLPDHCQIELLAEAVYECEGYRLPTSAEWEYAARAGTTTAFYSGPITSFERNDWCNWDPNLVRVAWYCANVPTMQEQQVAGLLPNTWGLYDVLGNADEWGSDVATGLPTPNPSTDPGSELVIRSVHRRNCQVNGTHEQCRVAYPPGASPSWNDAGFRLVRTLGKGTLPTLDDVPEEYRNGWDRPTTTNTTE